ncbi:MAG: cytochrome B [Pedobacter sp.]|nr:MAG: cytochrome B [Pedobacter sp.]
MYSFLLNLHSGFRYVVLILLVIALFNAIIAWTSKKPYTEAHRKLNLFTMISAHIQFLSGLMLYFYSPWVKFQPINETMKDQALRYWTVEHLAMMLFAIILITVGHSRSKKAAGPSNKHRAISIFYGLAVLIILSAITQSGRHL